MIELRVLGPPGVSSGGPAEAIVRHRKRLALLAYLGVATPRGAHRRDSLLALFWPESDDAHARAALNQALYVLRSRLGQDVLQTTGSDEVALNPGAVWCDAAAFEAALDGGRPDEALALYRGDLLEGLQIGGSPDFERWVDRERLRLRSRAAEGAWLIAEARATEHNPVEATRLARRAAELSPGDEVVARRLMTFLHGLGDRVAALQAYDAFAARLASEYELPPSAETQGLAAAMRSERQEAVPVFSGLPRRSSPATSTQPPIVPGRGEPATGTMQRGRRRPRAAAATLGVAAALGIWAWIAREPERRTEWVALLGLGDGPRLAAGVAGSTIALSRAGDLVYVGEDMLGQRLILKRPGEAMASPIPGTEDGLHPFFSPDGAWLGFVSRGVLRKVALTGDPPTDIAVAADDTRGVSGASWGDDDTIVFATSAALWRVPASGGQPTRVAVADTASDESYRWPDVLPGARETLFTIVTPTGFELATASLESGDVRRLGVGGTGPRFVEPGRVVFGRIDGTLLTAPFDARGNGVTGRVTQVAEGVQVGTRGAPKLGVSPSALAYVPAPPTDALVLVDRHGRAEPVPVRGRNLRPAPRSTADGAKILVSVNEPESSLADIWETDVASGALRRVTFDSGGVMPVVAERVPNRIVYATSLAGSVSGFELRVLRADGRGPERLLPGAPGQIPTDLTADGRTLVFQRLDAETQRDIWLMPLDSTRLPAPYARGPANERAAVVSPDGRWLAWVSDESGQDEIYVGAFPERGQPVRVSAAGGREPRWAREGRELFYRGSEGMVAVAIDTDTAPTVVEREVLFDDRPYLAVANNVGYDVHPDGRFVMLRSGVRGEQVLVWLDWMESVEP